MHAMEKDANKRYQSATDMIRDIEAFKANNQIIFGYYNAPQAPQQQRQYSGVPEQTGMQPRRRGNPTYSNTQQQPAENRIMAWRAAWRSGSRNRASRWSFRF